MKNENSVETDIALIRQNTETLQRSFEEYKILQKETIKNQTTLIEKMDERLTQVEISQAKITERQSGWNVFNTAFSTMASAIAAYLGIKN
jgi:hypothetical protein